MSTRLHSLAKVESAYATPLKITGVVSSLLLIVLLQLLGITLAVPALVLLLAGILWIAFRYPIFYLGGLLTIVPMDPLGLLLARFFGPSFLMSDMAKAFDGSYFPASLASSLVEETE